MTLADLVRGGDDPGQMSVPYAGSWAPVENDPAHPYADIFGYMGYSGPTGIPGGDDAGVFQLPPGPGSEVDGQWLPQEKYRGIVSYNTDRGGGDDPRQTRSQSIDWSKLPQPQRFGGIPIAPAVAADSLQRPDLVYEDPNYGWITPEANYKGPTGLKGIGHALANISPAVILALASGAFGGLVGPQLAGGLNFAGNSLLSGRIDPAKAVGVAAGFGGVDPNLISLAKLVYGMSKP